MTVEELKTYFDSIQLPPAPLKVNPSATITNVEKFVDAQFCGIEFSPNVKLKQPYIDRLIELREYIENQKQG